MVQSCGPVTSEDLDQRLVETLVDVGKIVVDIL